MLVDVRSFANPLVIKNLYFTLILYLYFTYRIDIHSRFTVHREHYTREKYSRIDVPNI